VALACVATTGIELTFAVVAWTTKGRSAMPAENYGVRDLQAGCDDNYSGPVDRVPLSSGKRSGKWPKAFWRSPLHER